MPRIAASVGVFVLIVFSIGFNMVRYPAVWEMVDGSSHLPQLSESSRPEAAPEPASAPQPEVAVRPTVSWQATSIPLPADDQESPRQPSPTVREESQPAADAQGSNDDVPGAEDNDVGFLQEVKPSAKYASSAGQPETAAPSASGGLLVQPVRSEVERESAAQPRPQQEVRRLPPVDPFSRPVADPHAFQSSRGPIPIYPTSGTQ